MKITYIWFHTKKSPGIKTRVSNFFTSDSWVPYIGIFQQKKSTFSWLPRSLLALFDYELLTKFVLPNARMVLIGNCTSADQSLKDKLINFQACQFPILYLRFSCVSYNLYNLNTIIW